MGRSENFVPNGNALAEVERTLSHPVHDCVGGLELKLRGVQSNETQFGLGPTQKTEDRGGRASVGRAAEAPIEGTRFAYHPRNMRRLFLNAMILLVSRLLMLGSPAVIVLAFTDCGGNGIQRDGGGSGGGAAGRGGTGGAGGAPFADAGVDTGDAGVDTSDLTDSGGEHSCLSGVAIQSECDLACGAGEICWDFNKHDPLCMGKICSIPCCMNSECADFAVRNGAIYTDSAVCGGDHLCGLVGVLGSFTCQ